MTNQADLLLLIFNVMHCINFENHISIRSNGGGGGIQFSLMHFQKCDLFRWTLKV